MSGDTGKVDFTKEAPKVEEMIRKGTFIWYSFDFKQSTWSDFTISMCIELQQAYPWNITFQDLTCLKQTCTE